MPETPMARGFFCASAPMLALDRRGRVAGVNAALRVLMGRDVAGCAGLGREALVERMGPRLEGEFFSAAGAANGGPLSGAERSRPVYREAAIAEGRCRYLSPEFGAAELSTVEIPSIDPSSGERAGSLLNVEILELENVAAYRAALRRRWAHEVLWEIYAVSYDAIVPRMPFYREVLERHLAAMRGGEARRVLDIGAGTGTVAVPLAREGTFVTAVDVSHAMLERLRAKLGPEPPPNLNIIEDTAEALSRAEDGSFDGVTVLNAFFDMGDPESALREAVRALRPGGTIVITDPKACFNARALVEFVDRYLREHGLLDELRDDWSRIQSVTPALEAGIAANRGERTPGPSATNRPPWHAEAILDSLQGSGFVDLSFEDAHLGQCATIRGKKPSFAGPPAEGAVLKACLKNGARPGL